MQVLDYSAGFPGAAAIKANGFGGAVRYIGSPGNIKCATADELRDFTKHGLGMALVFEQTAGQWRNGYGQGQRDATIARHHASAIGFPLDRPIYFAIDQDVVTEAEFEAMDSYADGWASVLGHDLCGPYGEHDVVARCWNRGFKWTWQCRAWSGIPVARMFAPRRLFQRVGTVNVGGVDCDINDVNAADWGQHLEDDMGWHDRFPDKAGGSAEAWEFLTGTWNKLAGPIPVFGQDRTTDLGTEIGYLPENFRAVLAGQAAILAAVNGGDVAAAVDEAVKRHTPTAEQNAAALEATFLPEVAKVLQQVRDTDNIDEAKRTADELLRLLGEKLAPRSADV